MSTRHIAQTLSQCYSTFLSLTPYQGVQTLKETQVMAWFDPRLQPCHSLQHHCKSINAIHYINETKDKNQLRTHDPDHIVPFCRGSVWEVTKVSARHIAQTLSQCYSTFPARNPLLRYLDLKETQVRAWFGPRLQPCHGLQHVCMCIFIYTHTLR